MTTTVDWIPCYSHLASQPDEWIALDNDDNYLAIVKAVYDVNRGAVLYWVGGKDFTTLQKAKDYCEKQFDSISRTL